MEADNIEELRDQMPEDEVTADDDMLSIQGLGPQWCIKMVKPAEL